MALDILRCPRKRGKALRRLLDGFFAASAAGSKNSKRKTEKSLAKEAMGPPQAAHPAEHAVEHPVTEVTVLPLLARGGNRGGVFFGLGKIQQFHRFISLDGEIIYSAYHLFKTGAFASQLLRYRLISPDIRLFKP